MSLAGGMFAADAGADASVAPTLDSSVAVVPFSRSPTRSIAVSILADNTFAWKGQAGGRGITTTQSDTTRGWWQ